MIDNKLGIKTRSAYNNLKILSKFKSLTSNVGFKINKKSIKCVINLSMFFEDEILC